MDQRHREVAGAIGMVLLVSFFFWQSGKIDLAFSSELETLTGPRAYPRIILTAMGLLCAVQLFQALSLQDGETVKAYGSDMIRVGLMIALVAVFAATFEPLGYVLTAPLLVYFSARLNRAENQINAAAVALIVSAVILVVFRYGLNTVLPEGVIGIDQVF